MLNVMPNTYIDSRILNLTSDWEEQIILCSGKAGYMRPIKDGDERYIEELYACLSLESQKAYFNASVFDMVPTFLARMAKQSVDTALKNGAGYLVFVDEWSYLAGLQPVAFGYYVNTSPGIAKLSVTVDDSYQNQGVGTQLIQQLIKSAQEKKISALEAYVVK